MKTQYTLRFTSDPGHGWLHVKRALAREIMGSDFVRLTQFSYQRGGTLYLEEDQDAFLFMNCARAKGITIIPLIRHCERTPIRSYQPLCHYALP